ncbi:MAG: hypothetical protein LBK68_03525 [Candidatus Margulisbacteria bacterium]|jgi:hypothetical protein|nr:hypothetical protein [Candidatus Margulisiibacteriota bacterium]
MDRRIQEGKFNGGHEVFGYDIIGECLTINEKECFIVILLFEKYKEICRF